MKNCIALTPKTITSKKSVLLFLCLFIYGLTLAQNEQTHFSKLTVLKKMVPLSRNFSPYDLHSLTMSTFDNHLRFSCYNIKDNTDSVWIYHLNLENFKIDSTVYIIENLSNYFQKYYCKNLSYIAFNQHWTVIGVYGLMYIYDDKNALYKKIEMKESLMFVKFIDDNQLLCAWNFNRKNKKNKPSAINLFDVVKGEYVKSVYPVFDMIQYSQFSPNHWIDATANSILYSQTSDYKIDIYNRELQRVDSIRYQPIVWDKLPLEVERKITKKKLTGAEAIYTILPYEKTTSRIRQAHFINDSTILTYYSIPAFDTTQTQPDFAFDLWRRGPNGWKMLHQNLVDRYADEELITASNYPLFEDKLNNLVAFSGQYLIAFMSYAPIDPVGLSKKDYKQQCDDYLLDNSPCLVLYVYSLNLN